MTGQDACYGNQRQQAIRDEIRQYDEMVKAPMTALSQDLVDELIVLCVYIIYSSRSCIR